MDVVARVLAACAGTVLAFAVVASAVRTVVVPRAEPSMLTRGVFNAVHWAFDLRVRRASWKRADRVMARYAPTALLVLPAAWMALVLLAFVPIYWAAGVPFWNDAFTYSGSSLLTLGFAFRDESEVIFPQFAQATVGLGLVALLISFLPSMYGQFSRRELLVAQLETRAGRPPTPVELLLRAQRIGWLEHLDDLWVRWERWFIEIEEAHTSFSALNYFRSPQPGRSWITAAGCVLDTAALRASTLHLPRSYHAELCIRSGYLALRRICDVFDIVYEADPTPDGPVSITREEFLQVYERLGSEGVPVVPDRERAWRAFAGWRVNYDTPLLALCSLTRAPIAPWSSDRAPTSMRLPTRPGRAHRSRR